MFDLERCKRMLAAKSDTELHEMLACPEELVPEALAAVKNEFERRNLAPPDLTDKSALPSELILTPSELLLLDAHRFELNARVSKDTALTVLLAAFVAEPVNASETLLGIN